MSAHAHNDMHTAIRQLRRRRRRVVQRQRRRRMLGGAAVLSLALASALAVASFTGTDLAGAAAVRATNLLDLLNQRSPGARMEAQLTKTKARHAMLADRSAAPAVHLPANLAEVLAPAPPAMIPVAVELPTAPALFAAPTFPGAVFLTPGGGTNGGGGTPGGGSPGGGGPGSPPGDTPGQPAPVPEPGTWLTMLVGFALIGSIMRGRRRSPLVKPA